MMKTFPSALAGTALGALLTVSATAHAATVNVSFVDPDNFADAGYSQSRPTERDLTELRAEFERYLKRLADASLAPNAVLKLEMLDIDLAGQVEPGRRLGNDIRVVREVTIPRLKFRYSLQEGDRVVANGEEYLTDLDFLHSVSRVGAEDRFRYEKSLLTSWFGKRFGKL